MPVALVALLATGLLGARSVPARAASEPHVLVVMLENKGYAKTLGNCSADPYLCSLASSYASFTAWTGVAYPSLPNYLAITSGSTQGCTSDTCTGPYTGDLMAQLSAATIPWVMYAESMPSACLMKDAKPYVRHHNPGTYFSDDGCTANDLPYPGASGLVSVLASPAPPDFVWITPNNNDDMANGTVSAGDAWLQANLSGVLTSAWFSGGNATVIVTMDESDFSKTNQVPMVVISSNASGLGNQASAGNHYATLGAIETAYGLPLLGAASNVPALRGAFGTSLSPGTITGVVTDSSASSAIGGATVSCTCSGTNQTTDGTGAYTFSSVPPGAYSMTFSASGYASQTINNVTVAGGSTTTENVALGKPGMITGMVTDSSTSAAIVGATVSCTCSGTNQTTDGTGSYTFSSVPSGTYSMTFAAGGHVSQTVNGVAVTSGGTTTESVALTRGTISPTLVQDVDRAAGADGASASVSPASTKASDLLVLSVTMDAGSGNASGSITGVTDSSGTDTWTRAVADNPSTRIGAEVWYVANAPAGVTLVTASFSKPVNAVLRIYEIQGAPASPLDQVHAAAGSGTTVSSGPTSTTSGSNDILIATVGFVSTSATISGLTSGFSNDLLVRNSLTNFNNSEQAGHEIVTSTGAYSYGGTLSGSQVWAAAIAAFE
jgi:phosphatidylinositol-3-phosphatase